MVWLYPFPERSGVEETSHHRVLAIVGDVEIWVEAAYPHLRLRLVG